MSVLSGIFIISHLIYLQVLLSLGNKTQVYSDRLGFKSNTHTHTPTNEI